LRLRDQLVVAAVLGVATWYSLLRVAESKNQAAVGPGAFSLERGHAPEREALDALRARLSSIGQAALAERLDELRSTGALWVAPALGSERWAVFVESLRLVRRIYIRRVALLDPRAHLYEHGTLTGTPEGQATFAWLSLCGALRHEIAHFDGVLEEAAAYDLELAWYEEVRASPFVSSLQGGVREAWLWALDSAVLSAREAARKAAEG
jgi:hypothetical protein